MKILDLQIPDHPRLFERNENSEYICICIYMKLQPMKPTKTDALPDN